MTQRSFAVIETSREFTKTNLRMYLAPATF